MGNLNKVLLIGHIGQDPEKRITPGGHSVVNISLATTERFKDKEGNNQERTEWHRVVFWNRQAELIEQYCGKGSQIYVEGSLQTREWQDKDGNRRFSTDIVARNMQFLDSKPKTGQGGYQGDQRNFQQNNGTTAGIGRDNMPDQSSASFQEPPASQPSEPARNDDFMEDDIPF